MTGTTSGRAAIEEHIEDVYMLVAHTVCRCIKRGPYDLDDLIQEGMVGVLTNAHQYDPDKGALSTFVHIVVTRWLWSRVFAAAKCQNKRVNHETISLNDTVRRRGRTAHGGDMDVERIDLIASNVNVEEEAVRQAEAERIMKLARSSLRKNELYALRRMIMDEDEPTLEAVSKELGVTKERVRQLKLRAIQHIKAVLRA